VNRPDPKYVASTRPVNQRTVGRREPLPPEPVNPLVQKRLAAAHARNRLGPALAEQVRARAAASSRGPLPKMAVAGGVTAAASGVALLLGLLTASPLLGVAGAGGALVGLFVARRGLRASAAAIETPALPPLFDEACLQALDRAIDLLAPEVPDAVAAQLVEFKQLIVRLAHHPGAAMVDENFTMEDRMYLRECVTRYLPDSLQGYIAVPARDRQAVIDAEGASAQSLLESQLATLRAELERREARMAQAAAEPLLKQQRFLKAKSGR
jgi:hypothetical protein